MKKLLGVEKKLTLGVRKKNFVADGHYQNYQEI